MSLQVSPPTTMFPIRRALRSIGAVVAGIAVGAVLSLGTDQALHELNVYPPWGQPMAGAGLYLLALGYRLADTVLGAYVTARLAPAAPSAHVWVLAAIGFAVCTAGVVANGFMPELGPLWYPVALAILSVPATWAGGCLYRPPIAKR